MNNGKCTTTLTKLTHGIKDFYSLTILKAIYHFRLIMYPSNISEAAIFELNRMWSTSPIANGQDVIRVNF